MTSSKTRVDPAALIDGLANHNPPPKLVGNDRVIPVFDEKYMDRIQQDLEQGDP